MPPNPTTTMLGKDYGTSDDPMTKEELDSQPLGPDGSAPAMSTTTDPARIEAACLVLHGAEGWCRIRSNRAGWAERERELVGRAIAAANTVSVHRRKDGHPSSSDHPPR